MSLSYRKKNILLLSVSLVVLFFVYITDPISGGLCQKIMSDNCVGFMGGDTGVPFFFFSGAIAIISFILLFLKEQIFNLWKKFATVFIAISAIWIFFAPEYCGGGWAGFGGCMFDKETTAMFTAGLFFIISLILIALKSKGISTFKTALVIILSLLAFVVFVYWRQIISLF